MYLILYHVICNSTQVIEFFSGGDNHIIRYFPHPIMLYVLGGCLHKYNTSYLFLGVYHASVNDDIHCFNANNPQNKLYYGIGENSEKI